MSENPVLRDVRTWKAIISGAALVKVRKRVQSGGTVQVMKT